MNDETSSTRLTVASPEYDKLRTPLDSQSEYTEICLPTHTNLLGNMLGGHVMHLVDLCGAVAAMRHARTIVVTASIDRMTFLHPISLGDLVFMKARVNRAYRTSMEVGVKVWVENLETGEIRHTSSAYLTYVGVDKARNRVLLPPIVPQSEEDRRRFDEAGERRAYRLALKAQIQEQREP